MVKMKYIKATGLWVPALQKKLANEVSKICATSLQFAAMLWHAAFRPKHFTQEAYSRYPNVILQRSVKYNRSKKQSKPLVRRGVLMRLSAHLVRQGKTQAEAKGGIKRATITMQSTPFVNTNWKNAKGGKFVSYAKQMTAVNAVEQKQINNFLGADIAKALNNYEGRAELVING